MKFFCILSLLFHSLLVSSSGKQVYVVYFGEHKGNKSPQEIERTHHSYLSLVKVNDEDARSSLVYSYKHSINGFAAILTPDEASKLSDMKEVISVIESLPGKYSPQTTRSWQFLGLEGMATSAVHNWSQSTPERDMLLRAKYGTNIIVGILDTGIWPESRSFGAHDMDPIPESWNGACQIEVDFNSSCCNRKIIGAKYYLKAFERQYGALNLLDNSRSPRDLDGHGTHIASIAAGRAVDNAAALGGYAHGTAYGGAPMSRLAIYKICWRVPHQSKYRTMDCLMPDFLAAVDDAISDGVHVMSISIISGAKTSYDKDNIAIGALHAVKNNIVVVCAAGNRGPRPESVFNVAPWIITTGASSIDRVFTAHLTLGDNTKIKGQSITPYELEEMHPLAYAGDVENPGVSDKHTGKCYGGSLSPEKARGKIILCNTNVVHLKIGKSHEVQRVGGVGIVLADDNNIGVEFSLNTHLIPAIILTTIDASKVLKYINYTNNPVAFIGLPMTMPKTRPASSVCNLSSRGPNVIDPHILKPDLIAPGLNILAAWSEGSSPSTLINDPRIVKYNIVSGTSMAVPHVVGVASLLKAIYPTWSHAAIKYALMTSALVTNNIGTPITDYDGKKASPFALGSGNLTPIKAADPGLVYDTSYTDYLLYLCSIGIKNIEKSLDPGYKCPEESIQPYDLNYPSMLISSITDSVKVRRRVTNVGDPRSKYIFVADPPMGFLIEASPYTLQFENVGEIKEFSITLIMADPTKVYPKKEFVFGWYAWTDDSYFVRSQIVISV